MARPTIAWRKVAARPGALAVQVLKAFQKNQGLLLSRERWPITFSSQSFLFLRSFS
jgi:hypothetical protein